MSDLDNTINDNRQIGQAAGEDGQTPNLTMKKILFQQLNMNKQS